MANKWWTKPMPKKTRTLQWRKTPPTQITRPMKSFRKTTNPRISLLPGLLLPRSWLRSCPTLQTQSKETNWWDSELKYPKKNKLPLENIRQLYYIVIVVCTEFNRRCDDSWKFIWVWYGDWWRIIVQIYLSLSMIDYEFINEWLIFISVNLFMNSYLSLSMGWWKLS